MPEPATLRILDANANRAREALRVAEDYARFALDSARLAEALKTLRHQLRERLDAFGVPHEALLAARDTSGDVGTGLSTEPEMRRTSVADVAKAALKRLEEALRCLEEYGKTVRPDAARGIQAIRYAAYELELQLFKLPRGRLVQAQLYVLVAPVEGQEIDLVAAGRAALRGGADILQLRHKHAPGPQLLALARELREATREHDALLIINDRPDIALLADADGVHLGADDLPIRAARRLLGPERLIGGTANTVALAQQAEAEGADYLGCGAVFPSPTKPDREVIGPARVAKVAKAVRIPVFAIGGIALDNVAELAAAGCDRIAVSSAVLASGDIEATAHALKQRLRAGPQKEN
ncbi:MAG TPA: thiamine phosphate synthase [Planctomycetota bacterium]|nr:thiamine phosphate synthase [Planctomycetota bacterium]